MNHTLVTRSRPYGSYYNYVRTATAAAPTSLTPLVVVCRLKCSSIYLGGSKDSRGCCQPMQPAPCCCDRLKCISCDFQVLWWVCRLGGGAALHRSNT
jgi:hypothetical protein